VKRWESYKERNVEKEGGNVRYCLYPAGLKEFTQMQQFAGTQYLNFKSHN